LCAEVCPTSCLHMGDNHDLSCYRRTDCVADFVALAREGRQTPEPLWMSRPQAPAWVLERRRAWDERATPHRDDMLKTLEESAASAVDKAPAKGGEAKKD
jgi:NADH-quinone oxidoreductase subunit I